MTIYQVDAFADHLFGGNPASVCPLNHWLTDEQMQNIAMENNQAETCFFVPRDDYFEIRWFTPVVEVDLCGHATLAAAYVLFNHTSYVKKEITFVSPKSGILKVRKQGSRIILNFPTDQFHEVELNKSLTACFDRIPKRAFKGKTDYLMVFKAEKEIQSLKPNLSAISQLNARGVIVTAPGKQVDFVSRFFAPQSGIDEDPVTGSAHTTLVPYWFLQTGKIEFQAIQLSKRRGFLRCRYLNDRVEISGNAFTYLIGEINF